MKVFQILVTRDTTESVLLTIPAESVKEAREKLMGEMDVAQYAEKDDPIGDGSQLINWQPDDYVGEPYLGDDSDDAFEGVEI